MDPGQPPSTREAASLRDAEKRLGTTIKGKWRLVRLIGVGGSAAVYEAQHRNGSHAAVKILHRHISVRPEQLARFRVESQAANRVGHPGVVVVRDDDVDDDGSPFLVMDLLQGRTVAELSHLRGGVLPPDEVLALADRLLDVLIAAHGRGIVHRDIKPQNLFVTDAGELRVLDFGIARLHDLEFSAVRTEAGTVLGTPAFLPPEQARGRADEIDARSDVWAVGATMYTLLTGSFVHPGATANDQLGLAMVAQARSLAEANPALPPSLVAIVDRALAYAPADRFPDARSMQAAVRAAGRTGDEPVVGLAALQERPGTTTLSSTATGSSIHVTTATAPRRRATVAVVLVATVVLLLVSVRPVPRRTASATANLAQGPTALPEPPAHTIPTTSPSAAPPAPSAATSSPSTQAVSAERARVARLPHAAPRPAPSAGPASPSPPASSSPPASPAEPRGSVLDRRY